MVFWYSGILYTLIKTNYNNILQDGYVRYVRYGYGHDEFI